MKVYELIKMLSRADMDSEVDVADGLLRVIKSDGKYMHIYGLALCNKDYSRYIKFEINSDGSLGEELCDISSRFAFIWMLKEESADNYFPAAEAELLNKSMSAGKEKEQQTRRL